MNFMRKRILECFSDFAGNDDQLINELGYLVTQHGIKIYSGIFHILTDLDMEPDEAEISWHQVVGIRNQMSAAMGRKVCLRTAVCDYLSSVNKSLNNHKLIDMHTFEQTTKLSRYDSLTDLLNRGSFETEVCMEISRAKRNNDDLSLIFFDLDDFKKVNDSYGHQAGDDVLSGCATIIKREKRKEDIAARYGGEELVILLPNADKTIAMKVADRVRRSIEKMLISHDDRPISVTVSGGVASFPVDASNKDDLIKSADRAMYRAKSFGKNTICLYSAKKRHSARYDYRSEVKLQPLGLGTMQKLSAISKDISVDGILFESSTALELGATVELTINLNDDKSLLLVGTVARVVQVAIDSYDVGISFLRTSKSAIEVGILDQLPKPQERPDDVMHFFCHH